MHHIVASPSVRALALRQGIDIQQLAKDLQRSQITREDLMNTATQPDKATGHQYWQVDHQQYGPVSEHKRSRFDHIAAENLSAAHRLIPQVTHHDFAEIDAVEALRQHLKPQAQERGIKLTALAFQVKALAWTLQHFPKFNASLSSDEQTLFLKDFVHIGIAVDTEYGLMVPVIRDADQKGVWEIAADIADLAQRAKARKITPDDMGGASMTISNIGGIGGTSFTPIVNPPEVAILGITRTEMRPKWDGETFKPVLTLPLDLSYDHRVINGAEAARFISTLAQALAEPYQLLI